MVRRVLALEEIMGIMKTINAQNRFLSKSREKKTEYISPFPSYHNIHQVT